ncbi:MAG: DnaA N-terminal domain-containing protein [Alphaproteobacteria bacterium]|nr:DnaA N-terminal domain-containing protein [Alphaproteobacteria bacterium]
MKYEWYRVYHGMPEDSKLRVIAQRSKQLMAHVVAVWICVLDAASRHETRGTVQVDAEQIAVVQEIDQKIVESIIKAFREKGLINKNNVLTAWRTRQYATEKERAATYRDNKKEDETSHGVTENHAASHGVTPDHAPSHKNAKNDPDREDRGTEGRSKAENRKRTEVEEETDASAEKDQKNNSDKKIRAREEKGERERKKQKIGGQAADQKQTGSPILQEMLDIWNAEVQSKLTKGQKAILTAKRKEQMTQRWLDDFQQDMRAWRYYCQIIGASDFCLGRIAGKGWTIDLAWAVESSDHVAKILEGGFSGGNHPPKPPRCDVPALQQAWDAVLLAFEQKHSKAICRSWLAATVITRMQRHCDGALLTMQCPNKFTCEWITQHYLADLNRWWAEATVDADFSVTGLELVTEG